MAKKPSSMESPRRVKEFIEIAAKDRNNANSLRRLLYDVIVRDFESSTRDAAARFKQLLLESRERRRFRTHGKGLPYLFFIQRSAQIKPKTPPGFNRPRERSMKGT